uniref:Neurotransmitter-gated ion-channel ligand-binding domain-containing protein n=1 Tax=Meloidogyne incognita TaxID=6306 RepID=A0A914M5N6_MELIC
MAVGGGVSRIGVCRGGHVGVTGVGLLPPYFTLMKSTNNAPITQRKGPLFGLYRLTKLILIFSIIQFWYLWRGIEGFNFGDFSSPHQRLLSELFHNYDKRLQPIGENKFSKTVHINVTIVLGILIEMRENEQVAAYVISHIQVNYLI